DEVIAQFGSGTSQRQVVTARLQRIYHLARATGKLERLILFGSYITAKPDPNEVDIVLVMRDDLTFRPVTKRAKRCSTTRARRRPWAPVYSGYARRCLSWKRSRSSSRTGRSHATRRAVAL